MAVDLQYWQFTEDIPVPTEVFFSDLEPFIAMVLTDELGFWVEVPELEAITVGMDNALISMGLYDLLL